MEKLKDFIVKYRGAIMGAIIALIAILLQIHKIIIGFLIIAVGAFLGNYVQQNKEKVKNAIRKIVDKW